MKHAKQLEENIFADVVEKVQTLTISQRKYLLEILSDKKMCLLPLKRGF